MLFKSNCKIKECIKFINENHIDESIIDIKLNNKIHLEINDVNDRLIIARNNIIIKILIDNYDLIILNNKNRYKLIHLICSNSSPEMIKYIVDKGINFECDTVEKWRPIHIICCISGDQEIIKYFIDKGVSLDFKTNCGKKPLDLIKNTKVKNEIIKYVNSK